MPGAFPLPEGDVDALVRVGYTLTVRAVDEHGGLVPGALLRASTVGYEQEVVADPEGVAVFRAPRGEIRVEAMDARRFGAGATFVLPADAGPDPHDLRMPDRGAITGWVVDARTGERLSGAVVVHASRPELRTTTGSDGRFELEAPRVGRLAAFGRGLGWHSYDIPAAGELEVRLRPGVTVTGTVLDAAGEPLAGVRVRAAAPNDRAQLERIEGPVSGPDGRFRFDWLPAPPRGIERESHLGAHRRGAGWSDLVPVRPGADVVVQVRGERSVRATIARANGDPCARLGVSLDVRPEILRGHAATLLGLERHVLAASDAEGRLTVSGLAAQLPVRLEFEVDGGRVSRVIPPGGDVQEEIVLPPGKSISGRVVDVDGQPITLGGVAKADLINDPEFERLTRTAPLQPDGSFRIDDLPAGSYGVSAKVPTFQVLGAVAEAGDEGVELVAERPADLEFELVFPEGASLEPVLVRLRDATDPAVPARRVRIQPDASGARGLLELVRRGTYHVSAVGGRWRCRMLDVEVPDGRRPPLRLVMERTLVRSLRVESADGTALSGRRVVIAPVGARIVSPEVHYTGEGGAVEVGGLAEGDWIARVTEDGRPPIARRFTVSADDRDTIVLRYPAHGTLEVRVDREALADPGSSIVSLLDDDGRPIVAWGPGARELASRWRLPADGVLELRGVPAGTVTVRLSSTGARDTRRDVDVVEDSRATLRLP
jgi:hypothetical protein